jgi:hypothetical protein
VVGKLECESYFPENYNAVEVVQVAVQKKKKKKRGAKKSDAVSIANSEGDIIMIHLSGLALTSLNFSRWHQRCGFNGGWRRRTRP